MDSIAIGQVVQRQRDFFRTGQTRDVSFRIRQLRTFGELFEQNDAAILDALRADLNKPPLEAYGSEVGLMRGEIRFALRHLKSWAKPKRRPVHLIQFPSTAWLFPEPLGVTLILAPWNFPLLLLMAPLVGAIAAGDCAILKPSEFAPYTSALVARLVGEYFDPRHVTAVEGGPEVARALLAERFDQITYTGNGATGRQVMEAAAKHLTPVTLELGGKSPCVVDAEVDVDQAARRIAWGKFLNAGQICIAPDYVLVDRRVKPALLQALRKHIRLFYGDDPRGSPDYCRIISARHFERLCGMLPGDAVVCGGQVDATERYIAPTLIDDPPLDSAVMQEEIFGPLLPVIGYDGLDQAIAFVNARPKPLALYLFSSNRRHQQRMLDGTSSGGACINDTILHFTTPWFPFGGVGESGMGQYRGEAGFNAFSHLRPVLKKGPLDFWFRYPPYRNNHRILRWFL